MSKYIDTFQVRIKLADHAIADVDKLKSAFSKTEQAFKELQQAMAEFDEIAQRFNYYNPIETEVVDGEDK